MSPTPGAALPPAEDWVADSSPLILLAKIGLIPLLPRMTARLIIPSEVVREIDDAPPDDPARQALAVLVQSGVAQITTPTIPPDLTRLNLGRGETAVLAEALQRQATQAVTVTVLDDHDARSAARARCVLTIETAGILIRAKDDGHITEIRPLSATAAGRRNVGKRQLVPQSRPSRWGDMALTAVALNVFPPSALPAAATIPSPRGPTPTPPRAGCCPLGRRAFPIKPTSFPS